jgi:hypothetical protein
MPSRRMQVAALSIVLVLAAGISLGIYVLKPWDSSPLKTGAPSDNSTVNLPTAGSAANTTNATTPVASVGVVPLKWDGFEEMKMTADDYMQKELAGAYSVGGWVLTSIDPESCCVPATMEENVTGAQAVTGSWDAGYDVAYTGIRNIMIQFLPADFSVITASINPMPDRHEIVSFTSQEKQAIGFVLSDKTVQAKVDLSGYYVGRITHIPIDSANQTYAGDYFVYLNQIDGPGYEMVVVNPTLTVILGISP